MDVVDLERELATELEDMRRASRDTELQLSRQLEEARERVAQEAEARSLLLEELQHLRETVASHEQYQHQYQDDLDVGHHLPRRDSVAAGETDSLMSLSHLDQCEHDQHDDLSRREDQEHNDNPTNNHHEFHTVPGEQIPSSAEQIQAATVPLTTDDVNNDDDDEEVDDEDNEEDEGADIIDLKDVEWLRSEVQRLSEREATLVRALDQHKGKLALVLHRAALLSSPTSAAADSATASVAASATATINQLRHTLAEKDKHIASQQEHVNVLVQQLDGYRVEVTLLENQCQQSKEVGVLLGVAQSVQREERLHLQIEDLSSELMILKDNAEVQRQQQQQQGSGLLSPTMMAAETSDDVTAASEVGETVPSPSVTLEKAAVASSSSQTDDDCVLRVDAETAMGDDDDAFVVVGDGETTPKPSHEELLTRNQSLEEALAVQSIARQTDAEIAARALETETAALREELVRGADDLAVLHRTNDQLLMRLADLVELRQHLTVCSSSDATLMPAEEDVSRELETERTMRVCLQERLEEADRTRVALELDHEAETNRLLKVVEQLQSAPLPQSLEQTAVNAQSEPSREAALVIEVAMLQQEVTRLTSILAKETATTSSSQQTETAECDLVVPPVVATAADIDSILAGAAVDDVVEMKERLALAESQCMEAQNEAQQLRDQVTALLLPPPHKATDDQQLRGEAVQDKAQIGLDGLSQQSVIRDNQGMERDESSEKALALVALRRQHKTEMKQYRRRISTRCRALIDRQKAQFVAEREQTVLLVRQECADIVAEAQIMMQRNRERNQHRYHSFPPKVSRDFTPGGPMSPSPSPFYDPMAATVVSDASISPGQEGEQQQQPMMIMMSPPFDGRHPQ